MEIYFLRHGIAQDHAVGLPDAERELVEVGRHKIRQLAKRLPDFDVNPVVVYSSPLVRARQTAEIVTTYTGWHMEITDELDFGFNPAALQRLVDRHQPSENMMVVGHEPTFSETISYLIGGGNITMKKGGLARVDLFSQHPLHGTLAWLLAPKLV